MFEKSIGSRDDFQELEKVKLDAAFKLSFEKLPAILNKKQGTLIDLYNELNTLSLLGASAHALDKSELGGYNLAGLIDDISGVKDHEDLKYIELIAKLCIDSGVDLHGQKAYIGNGGAPTMYWLMHYLAQGVTASTVYRKPPFHFEQISAGQYKTYYEILSNIKKRDYVFHYTDNYFHEFLRMFKPCQNVLGYQRQILDSFQRNLGREEIELIKLKKHQEIGRKYAESFCTIRQFVLDKDFEKISWFFPSQEDKSKTNYIKFMEACMEPEGARAILHCFMVSREGRIFFRDFFNNNHWLIDVIIKLSPNSVKELEAHNEHQMVKPFRKRMK